MGEWEKRKQLRLRDYDYTQSGGYFITICTHDRQRLFGDAVGAHLCVRPNRPDQMVERWLLELEHKYENAEVDCSIVMPDHIHFILFNPGTGDAEAGAHAGAPLPEMIKWFKTQTTNEYIRGVKTGLYAPFERHVWQRNYYEHILRNDADLDEARGYVAGNPAKWELLRE